MINEINIQIEKMCNMFKNNQYLFLTEGDIHCYLYKLLSETDMVSNLKKSKDNRFTTPLHSEVSFFGENNKLSNRVDVAVVDVSTMDLYSIDSTSEDRRSKGYEFDEANVAIELKLNKNGGKEKVIKELNKDLQKLKRLKIGNPNVTFISIFFDKRNRLNQIDLANIKNKYPMIKVYYQGIDEKNN